MNNRQERLELAQQLITSAVELIQTAVKGTSERGISESYTVPWLRAFRDSSNQTGNIEQLINSLEDADDTEEEFDLDNFIDNI